MAREGGKDRGIFEKTKPCPECNGERCEACKGSKRKPCLKCPCRKCPACKGKGKKGTGEWWIRYHDQFQNEHREKVGTKGQARAAYEARKTDIRQEKFDPEAVTRRKPAVLVENAIKDYLREARPVSRDYVHMKHHGKVWTDYLKGNALEAVTPQMIERWRTARLKEVCPATVNRAITFLKRFYNVCIRNGLLDKSPCAHIRKLRENNARVRFLSDTEEEKLIRFLPAWLVPLVLVALGTGMRISEQLNLLWENVDFANEVITIPRSKHGEKRHIPMSADVVSVMRELPSRLKSPWVFPNPDKEGPLSRNGRVRGCFEKALTDAKIENFHWHDLRHSYASRLAMAGVDLLSIKELLGHKTLAMVQRYAHLSPDHLRQAAAKVRLRTVVPVPGLATFPPAKQDSEDAQEDVTGQTKRGRARTVTRTVTTQPA